jgi:OOP family OmpA-OmpF porin
MAKEPARSIEPAEPARTEPKKADAEADAAPEAAIVKYVKPAASNPETRAPETSAATCRAALDQAFGSEKILFRSGSAKLTPASVILLRRIAPVVARCENVEVVGHTDDKGKPDRNRRLSQKRAERVVAFLKEKGADKTVFLAIGQGASQPVAGNDTPEGKEKNRRVEFAVK